MNAADVIGYTFDADWYCTPCSVERFGSEEHGWVAEDAEDSEGNPVHPIFGDSEWWNTDEDACEELHCSNCGGLIDTAHRDGLHSPTCAEFDIDAVKAAAAEIGQEHGENAASWMFDGNTPEDAYQRVLDGLEDGDPEILDGIPSADLSGQWADGYTVSRLLDDIGYAESENDEEHGRFDWVKDDAASAYEEAFNEAAYAEVEKMAREHLGRTA